jgi:hypothetical protein
MGREFGGDRGLFASDSLPGHRSFIFSSEEPWIHSRSRDSRNPQVVAGLLITLFQIERDHEVCA